MTHTRAGDTDKGRIESYRHLRCLSPMLLGYSPKYAAIGACAPGLIQSLPVSRMTGVKRACGSESLCENAPKPVIPARLKRRPCTGAGRIGSRTGSSSAGAAPSV